MSQQFTCAECGTILSSTDKKCPNCGSNKRKINVTVQETFVMTSGLRGLVIEEGKSKNKWSHEVISRDTVSKATGESVIESRSIDRRNDKYVHRITKKDGTVIHEEDEKLSEHRKKHKDK